ncbi:MAG: hypothetical protein HPY85_07750 [Anaerolineae bacterium]|nr:hypothetical protein [Anaerolineae bacterium]
MTQGILYIAAGEKYIKAAIESAISVRRHCPGLAIHLFADSQKYASTDFSRDPYPFTSVEQINNPHRRSKVDYLPRTPFDHTLYLDTDTRLNTDIRPMFVLLERFDIALNHAHRRNDPTRLGTWRLQLPGAFPQHNGGVILYRKTTEVIDFLEQWRDAFHSAGFQQDQMTLRELLWLSNLRMAVLPPEFNVRYIKYRTWWTKAEALPQIYHLQRLHIGWLGWLVKPWYRRGLKLLAKFGIHCEKRL